MGDQLFLQQLYGSGLTPPPGFTPPRPGLGTVGEEGATTVWDDGGASQLDHSAYIDHHYDWQNLGGEAQVDNGGNTLTDLGTNPHGSTTNSVYASQPLFNMTPQALPFQTGNHGSSLTSTLGGLALTSSQPAPQATGGTADAGSVQGAICSDSSDSEYVSKAGSLTKRSRVQSVKSNKKKKVSSVPLFKAPDERDHVIMYFLKRFMNGSYPLAASMETVASQFASLAGRHASIETVEEVKNKLDNAIMDRVMHMLLHGSFGIVNPKDLVEVRQRANYLLNHDWNLHAFGVEGSDALNDVRKQQARLQAENPNRTVITTLRRIRYEIRTKEHQIVLHFSNEGLRKAVTELLLVFPAEFVSEITNDFRVIASAGSVMYIGLLRLRRGLLTWNPAADMGIWTDRTYELCLTKSENINRLLTGVTQGGDETDVITAYMASACNKARDEAAHMVESLNILEQNRTPKFPYGHVKLAMPPKRVPGVASGSQVML